MYAYIKSSNMYIMYTHTHTHFIANIRFIKRKFNFKFTSRLKLFICATNIEKKNGLFKMFAKFILIYNRRRAPLTPARTVHNTRQSINTSGKYYISNLCRYISSNKRRKKMCAYTTRRNYI